MSTAEVMTVLGTGKPEAASVASAAQDAAGATGPLLIDDVVVDLHLELRHLELRPVGRLDRRLHPELGGELPVLILRGRQVVRVRGLLDRPETVRPSGAPEPARDVLLDRLRVDALHADAREQHLLRDMPGAESRNLDPVCKILRRVLDRVLYLTGRDLYGQAGAVPVELLELGLHRRAIESERTRLPLALDHSRTLA